MLRDPPSAPAGRSLRCGLVVSTGASINSDLAAGIAVVDLPVQVDGQALAGGDTGRDFYARLRGGALATTSTPSPGDYLRAFRKCDADRVLCLTIPARWSGMDGSARLAARLLAEEEGRQRVTVVDTGTAAAGLGLVARITGSWIMTGRDSDSVLERTLTACAEVRMYGALTTLAHLARGGRVPGLVTGLLDSLGVRPVFRLAGGSAGRVALARTEGGALNALERAAGDIDQGQALWILVFHADAEARAADLAARLRRGRRDLRLETVPLTAEIGSHAGPGAVGFAALPLHPGDPLPADP